jgi:hypothetical protein
MKDKKIAMETAIRDRLYNVGVIFFMRKMEPRGFHYATVSLVLIPELLLG